MAKKRLTLRDKQGNVVDYDISAARVTIDAEGKTLEVKLSELVAAIEATTMRVVFNGNTHNVNGGTINLGNQLQPDWAETSTTYPSFIKNKPDVVTGIKVGASGSTITPTNGVVTIPESGGSVDVDNAMSASSDNPVANRVIKAYVDNLINGLINGAPAALDTLNELSAALGNDSNFAAAITQQLALKANDANVVKSISVNGQTPQTPTNGNVSLVIEAGARGPKGDTGNVRVDGVGNVLIINNLEDGGTDAALSAEMGKRIAIGSGNFAKAWAHSKAIPFPFMWVWSELVNGVTITKPIWHKGNSEFVDVMGSTIYVQASSAPGVPTMTGATAGATVAKNTPITIKPVADAAVLYTLDNWVTTLANDMDAVVRLTTSGEVTVKAKCVNTKGDSQEVSWSFTVQSTAITETDTEEGEVSRGQQVKITAEHELHYSTDGGTTWNTATDDNGTSATFTIDGGTQAQPMQIKAYDKDGNETGTVATYEYWMEALMAPQFSPDDDEPLSPYGDDIELTSPGALHIYYTLDGSTPTSSSTEYSDAIHVGQALTIKAIAEDNYGTSAVATATYTLKPMAIYIKTTGATTMNLGDSGLPDIQLTTGDNTITPANLGISSFADHEFTSLSFGDKTAIEEFDGCGLKVKSLSGSFNGASNLKKAVGIIVSNTNNNVNVGGSGKEAFYNATKATQIEVAGVVTNATSMFQSTGSSGSGLVLDVSGLDLNGTVLCNQMFSGAKVLNILDITSVDFRKASSASQIFFGCTAKQIIMNDLFVLPSINAPFNTYSGVEKVVIRPIAPTPPTGYTPPSLTNDWVAFMIGKKPDAKVHIPKAYENAFKNDASWLGYINNNVVQIDE